MIKFFSEIIGSDIVFSREKAKLSEATEIFLNPNDGSLLGIFSFDPIEGRERILPAAGIVEIKRGIIVGKEYDSIADPGEIVRIKEVLPYRSKIIGSKVYAKSGRLLGKVSDATLNVNLLALDKIYVNQLFSPKLSPKELIIPAKKIIEIQPKKIIVSDEFAKIKAPKLITAQSPVME